MAADPGGTYSPPYVPRGDKSDGQFIAWWASLLQLTTYRLGWAHPLRGLARWDQAGRPLDEPILAVVQRWWGPQLDDVLASGADSRPGDNEGLHLPVTPTTFERGTLFQPYWGRRSQPEWQQVWGSGTDPLHLWIHARTPLEASVKLPEVPLEQLLTLRAHPKVASLLHAGRTADRRPNDVLLLPSYAGWYGMLLAAGPPRLGGHDRRVDVVVTALGWLSQFRRSTKTGLWVRGSHYTHVQGNV